MSNLTEVKRERMEEKRNLSEIKEAYATLADSFLTVMSAFLGKIEPWQVTEAIQCGFDFATLAYSLERPYENFPHDWENLEETEKEWKKIKHTKFFQRKKPSYVFLEIERNMGVYNGAYVYGRDVSGSIYHDILGSYDFLEECNAVILGCIIVDYGMDQTTIEYKPYRYGVKYDEFDDWGES